MSIRLRLTLWYSFILTVTLLAFGISMYYLIHTLTMNQYKQVLEETTEKVEQRILYGSSFFGLNLDITLDQVDHMLSKQIYLQVVNFTSQEFQRSGNAVENGITIPLSTETFHQTIQRKATYETEEIDGYRFLIFNRPLFYRGQVVGVLQSAMYTGELLDNYSTLFIPAALTTIILAFSFGWFLARKALKPIDDVIDAASQIQQGADLDKRIVYDGPKDEIGRLIYTINGMLGRVQGTYNELEDSYRAQRRFVSDASHELRTPLTTIRGNVNFLQRLWTENATQGVGESGAPVSNQLELTKEAIQDITEEAERMSRLVNDMLSLARADAGFEMEKQWLPLRPLVDDLTRKIQYLPRRAVWRTESIDALNGVEVFGNKDYLQQMLLIFIENAFKYTEAGEVVLSAKRLESGVGIQITDTGIGMVAEEVPHIFDRFYRADESRGKTTGTGLGLSIAKWIIDEHQGSVEVLTQQGSGTSFTIWLPVRDEPKTIEEQDMLY